MELTQIEHIGIAVKNLDESIEFYENVLGLLCYAVEEVKDQKVKTAFFKIGETKIELLESTEPGGPISKFIEKRGEGIHHIAFKTKDINSSLKKLKEKLKPIHNLNQRFRKIVKQPEINQTRITSGRNINEEILDQLEQSQRTNIKWRIVSLFFAALSILVGFLHFYHTNNYSKLFQEIQILQEQSQDNTSMLLQQSKELDSLHYQVRTLEQSLQKDSLR